MTPRHPPKPSSPRKRGRPPKFGRPSEVVALTLPSEVVQGLRTIHPDVGWAVVQLFEKRWPGGAASEPPVPDVELVSIANRRSLIIVNRAIARNLPGIHLVPFGRDRAFLALEEGRGLTDLEIAVVDRMEDPVTLPEEREALKALRQRLRQWRLDPAFHFARRAIIVVEETDRKRRRHGAVEHR